MRVLHFRIIQRNITRKPAKCKCVFFIFFIPPPPSPSCAIRPVVSVGIVFGEIADVHGIKRAAAFFRIGGRHGDVLVARFEQQRLAFRHVVARGFLRPGEFRHPERFFRVRDHIAVLVLFGRKAVRLQLNVKVLPTTSGQRSS